MSPGIKRTVEILNKQLKPGEWGDGGGGLERTGWLAKTQTPHPHTQHLGCFVFILFWLEDQTQGGVGLVTVSLSWKEPGLPCSELERSRGVFQATWGPLCSLFQPLAIHPVRPLLDRHPCPWLQPTGPANTPRSRGPSPGVPGTSTSGGQV